MYILFSIVKFFTFIKTIYSELSKQQIAKVILKYLIIIILIDLFTWTCRADNSAQSNMQLQ